MAGSTTGKTDSWRRGPKISVPLGPGCVDMPRNPAPLSISVCAPAGTRATDRNWGRGPDNALTVTEMSLSKAQKWVELEATGNVIAEGQSFTALAARIGYTSNKDQLVLEGDGRNDAEFWHQTAPGSQHSHTAAGRIRFQRKTGTLEVNDGKTGTITLSNLPPSKKPLPRRR